MSNRYIGTYKALVYGNRETLNIINEIANASFNIGFPLEIWKRGLGVSLLLKKPNKICPSELRTIGTLEANFNQMASLHFSKRMMSTGIRMLLISSSQYAKKGNRSIEAAIVKILYFDYLCINRINGTFLAMVLENKEFVFMIIKAISKSMSETYALISFLIRHILTIQRI